MQLIDRKDAIPKAIEPCPIKSAVIELRYDENLVDPNLAIGLFFGKLKDDKIFVGEYQALAATTLPTQLRETDPALRYAPLYQIINDTYSVRLAKNSISICVIGEYKGWGSFFKLATPIFRQAYQLNLFKTINRLGIRYTSFFEFNVLPLLNLEFKLNNNNQDNETNFIRTEFKVDDLGCSLSLSNSAELKDNNGEPKKGSSIDIDVFKDSEITSIDSCIDLIEEAHSVEKRMFFTLVSDNFLEKYKVIK